MNGTGDLDNLDIYDDLNKKLKDDFDCIRRRDGSVMIDAKTRLNAIEVEKLQKIQNKDVNTARDLRLNSIRGTILVPLSEFKNEENMEERIQGHLQHQNIPVSNVTIFKKNSRKGNTLTCACNTFESRSIPASVRVGFEKVKVKEDIPKPRQCHTCWKLGHAKSTVRAYHVAQLVGLLHILCSNAPIRETTHTGDTVLTVIRMDTQPFLSCVHYTEEKRKYFSSCVDRVLPRERLESCLLILADMQTSSTLEQQQQQQWRQRQQQQPLEVVSGEQDESTQERVEHEVVVKNKPREISPEDRMGILFGEDPIGFLSVEAESTEQVSSEDLPSQVFSRRIPGTSKKREREEAFNPSPSERHHEPETPRRRYDPGPSWE